MPETRHLTDDDIISMLADEATATSREQIEFHLSQCAGCRERLVASYRNSQEQPVMPLPPSLQAKALEIPRKQSQRPRRIFSFSRLAVAAAVTAIALTALLYVRVRMIPEPVKIVDVETSQGTAAYWIERYGVLSPVENPWAARAKKVFHRMALVADQRKQNLLRLILIRGEATPYAIALRDGSIVLSANALRVCYQDVPPHEGDTRFAFVLGHELVHLKDVDFGHYAAFAALQRHEAIPQGSTESERKADAYGLVYATMAGYDPQAVLKDANGFLQAWVSQSPQQETYKDTTHPEPAERVKLLHSHLKSVADDLDYFHFSVRLYQIGRYDDAILFLQRFAEKFPAREVFNNLGLSHYQLAMQTLASCNPALVQQFYAATFLDTQTLAGRLRTPQKTPCLEKEAFRDQIQEARIHFQRAIEMDPVYVPAKVNLSSLQLILGEYDLARETLKEAAIQKPEEPAVLNNQGLLMYLSDDGSALSILQEVFQKDPHFAPALYNKALIEAKTGQVSESRDSWNRFLEQESSGLYAQEARKRLGIKEAQKADATPKLNSPIPLRDAAAVRPILEKMNKRSLSTKELDAQLYESADTQVVVLDGIVEIVETDPPSLSSKLGAPKTTHLTPSGRVEVYRNFTLDIREGQIYRIIYFE